MTGQDAGASPRVGYKIVAVMGLALLGACSRTPEPSGTYLAKGPNYAIMLHLEAADGQQLRGSIMSREFKADWTIEAVNRPIAGTIEGKAINLTIVYPPGNNPTSVPLSGLMTKDGMDLTIFANGRATDVTFRRGTAEEYQKVVKTIFNQVAQYD